MHFSTKININKKFWKELIAYVSHLFKILEPNLMELNLSEFTLISLNST
jgi:hypothetical protein